MRSVPDLSRVYHLRIGQLQYSYLPLASTCQKIYDKIAPKSIFNYRIILFLFHHICLTFKKWKLGELVEISHRDKCEILVFTADSERRLNDEFRLARIAEGVVIEVVKEEALIEISFDLTLAPSEAFLKCVVDSLCALVIGNSLFCFPFNLPRRRPFLPPRDSRSRRRYRAEGSSSPSIRSSCLP